jgi:hypothetical protein
MSESMFSWLGWHRRAGKRKWKKVATGATQAAVKDALAKLKLVGETLIAPASTDPNEQSRRHAP